MMVVVERYDCVVVVMLRGVVVKNMVKGLGWDDDEVGDFVCDGCCLLKVEIMVAMMDGWRGMVMEFMWRNWKL
jgi:hypothetical protein